MALPDVDPRQDRGQREAYERYLRGMDASMRQKVALTAAHLLCVGKVADMGMGSGAGSFALAALYPELEVVGVDLDPQMVELAAERHRRPNLSFVRGDIAEAVFPEASLDGIFDSSVLHHVTSYGGYVHANAARAIRNQVRALRPGGVLVVRDFLAPHAVEATGTEVWLDLPSDDGDDGDDPRTCSSAALLRRFGRQFRSLSAHPGCSFEALAEPPAPGFRRFRLPLRLATELLLRKDYRDDWDLEIQEEYCYFTQGEFEALFEAEGLRVVASTPLRNPWIVKNRFEGRARLFDLSGQALPWPPTNYLIAGERVNDDEGVVIRERGATPPLGFLEMSHYRSRRDESVRDLVRRPNMTIDVLPFFALRGDVYVIARMGYPRPILAATAATPALDGSRLCQYVTEPLCVIAEDKPLGQTVEELLARRAQVDGTQIRSFLQGSTYYPSPGGSQEEVRSVFVEIEPFFVRDEEAAAGAGGTPTAGRLRAIEAEQVLRAAQVGGLPDARLELNVYDLFSRLGRRPGPWIGDAPTIGEGLPPADSSTLTSLDALAERPARRAFVPVDASASRGFLTILASAFDEVDRRGRTLATHTREYVLPRTLSSNTVACALLLRLQGTLWLGVDDDDLPAAQCFSGNSQLLVAPAWRLPVEVSHVDAARRFARERIEGEYGLRVGATAELGGRYHPSAGLSPELVFPLAVEVLDARDARRLVWFPLREVARPRPALVDGHLRITALRAAHALGMLD